MNQPFVALALQLGTTENSMWIIAVLVILFFIVVIVGVGLAIFFVMRKRKKAQKVPAASAAAVLNDAGYSAGLPQAAPQVAPAFEPPPSAAVDLAESEQETRWPSIPDVPPAPPIASEVTDFDPSRTVAIVREPTVAITYGTIKFVSGVLAGEEFAVEPEGAYIGREPSLSQIVVSDPRISKRHLWVGVRDGVGDDCRSGVAQRDLHKRSTVRSYSRSKTKRG